MIWRRPNFFRNWKRAVPSLWLAAALLLQGMPPLSAMEGSAMSAPVMAAERGAHAQMTLADEAVPPCHDAADPQPQPRMPVPDGTAPEKAPMACCTAAICGMVAHALPPPAPFVGPVPVRGFDRPAYPALHLGALAPPLLRPPAILL